LFFGGIPWAITYLLMLKLQKVSVRQESFWGYFVATIIILSFVWAAGVPPNAPPSAPPFVGQFLAYAIVLSVFSCGLLRWQERKHRHTASQDQINKKDREPTQAEGT
jgi:protein-S-isoprenylcysteine O-methyltransferase Ste14